MTGLYTEYRSFKREEASVAQVTTSPESIAFAELVSFIEDICINDSNQQVFKLSEMCSLYKERIEQLQGSPLHLRVNNTQLKEKLLQHFHPDLEAHKGTKEVVFNFKDNIG